KRRLLIKPNFVTDDSPQTGITSHPTTVRACCEYALECGFKKERIMVGEGGIAHIDTTQTFHSLGLYKELEGLGIDVVDLNREDRLTVKIDDALALDEVGISRPYLTHDGIISCTKLKIHSIAMTTLCMKNMLGGVRPKNLMHYRLHEKIVDLNRRFPPTLCVIEGVIGCQSYETSGDVVRSNLVVVGNNMVATDAVGSYLMGVEPSEVPYLVLAEENGLGTCDLSQIDIVGDIHSLRKEYRRGGGGIY
ncbi:MAG: DUF362 domain-containing protein, partial [Methermicoccaceae archaeon]